MGKEVNRLNLDRQRQRYDKAFKLNAVALLKAGNKPATQLALALGIRRNLLYKWAEVLERSGGDVNSAFNGPSHNKLGKKHDPLIAENKRLKRQLARANAELDILKKFDAYLTKASK